MGSFSSALVPDTEEFHSVVSVAEELEELEELDEQVAADPRLQPRRHTLVTLMMAEERRANQSEEPDSFTPQETRRDEASPPAAAAAASPPTPTQSFTSLLPRALSAVLHLAAPPGLAADPQPGRTPPGLGQLQAELRDLRDQFELMKSQHNKEIHLLMNELDEEKRIRLTLQMEIQRMKKHMYK
ncbi:SH3 domain-containing kinase-binding protein 1 [Pseudoliparis swirei]|uniref:SH3 domain-containing kinase-binding protein 1 n=1 Tax=Pseudoliparis swirei TaxID=2059687 RepID=UPI0024BE4857|nr:SH3 domain-containing kinase-binding protein 1 [Pseudoliparis swirei]XP_056267548.1 SH3 domain-containing kinase-binding protein 1 [Pseudoliparis swirei]